MEIYETHELVEVISNFPPVPSFFLDTYFRRTFNATTEYIDFDLIDKGRRLAPFVVPNVQGQPMLQRGYSTRKFKPAYIKMKDAVDPQRTLIRTVGEQFGGDLTPEERENAIIVDLQQDHRDMIARRWEWMAAQALIDGQVTVEGENYPERTVQFGRSPGNTETLTGTAQWSNPTTAKPLDDIKRWSRQIFRSGVKANRLTMSPDVATAFFATDQVKEQFETRRGTSFGENFERNNLNADTVTIHGVLPGGIEVVTYSDIYEDNMGEEQPFMPSNVALLTGNVEGVRAFGAIMDRRAQYRSMDIFPKMYEDDDPSGLFLLTQSAPLMVPLRPNASFRGNVIPAS